MDLPFMTLSEESICLPSEAARDPFVQFEMDWHPVVDKDKSL